jgi:predicted Fe-Mo cluster-binding NifX family protein
MKIAVVTNDGRSISAHFGRARQYLVLTIENGAVVQRELRDKTPCDHSHHGHDHGHGHDDHDHEQHADQAIDLTLSTADHAGDEHSRKVAVISDCTAVLSRGMGQGMHRNLQRSGIRAVLTDIVPVDEAVQAFLSGQLQERPELVH